MILPDTMEIVILVPEDSRATAWVSFDGRHRVNLLAGDSVKIQTSQFPVPTVCVTVGWTAEVLTISLHVL